MHRTMPRLRRRSDSDQRAADHGTRSLRPRSRFGRLLVAAAAGLAGTVVLVAAPPATAANPGLTAPERLYTGVNETIMFDDAADDVSGDPRTVQISASEGACNTAGPAYSISGCSRIQMTLNDASGGKIYIPDIDVKQDNANQDVLVAPSNAILDVSTDAGGGPGVILHLSGTTAQINGALDTLQYIPATDFESGADASPYIYLHLLVINGTLQTETTEQFVEIRVEGDNGAPSLDATDLGPLEASTAQSTSFPPSTSDPAVFTVEDPEMCTEALCGPGYPNPSIDGDDTMLLVASLSGCANSTFQFRGGAFTELGGTTNDVNTIHGLLLTDGPGLGLETDQAAAIEASLLGTQLLDFDSQNGGGPLNANRVFAGVGEFDEVLYALSQVTFDTNETEDTTCLFEVWVSDLGNNGMPLAYVGSPIGGPVENPEPGYEVPDAKGAYLSRTVQFSDTQPDVVITPVASDPTNDDPIDFAVAFSEPVDGVEASDFTVTNGTVDSIDVATPLDIVTVALVSVTPSGDGAVKLQLPANAVQAEDDDTGNDESNEAEVEYDGTAPTVAVDQTIPVDPTEAETILFTATFSEDVTGLTNGDVDLGGTAGATSAVVSGGPSEYQIAVSGMTVDGGTVIVGLPMAAAQDAAGNDSAASAGGDDTVTWNAPAAPDVTSPTPEITQITSDTPDPASGPSVQFQVDFGEPVTGFTQGDVIVGGTAGASMASVSGGPTVYTVTVSGMSTDGTVTITFNAGAALDLSNNPSLAPTLTDNSIDWTLADTTGPSVTVEQAAGQADPSNGGSATFTITFSEPVDPSSFNPSGLVASPVETDGGILDVSNPTTWEYTAFYLDPNVTVTLTLAAGTVSDLAGNPNEVSTSVDNSVTLDDTGPTITSVTPAVASPGSVSTQPMTWTVEFDEPVTGFDTGDLDFTGTNPLLSPVPAVTGGPQTYTVEVTGLGADAGSVFLGVDATGVTDLATNPGTGTAAAEQLWAGDTTGPSVVSVVTAPGQPTPATTSAQFVVTFDEPVAGLATADLVLVATGSVSGANVGTITPAGSATEYTVTVNGLTGVGTLRLDVSGASAVVDLAGNALQAGYTTGDVLDVDSVRPTVTVEQAGSDPTSTSPIQFTVTFSEPVTGFTAADVNVSASTAGGSLFVSRTGGPSVYTVSVTGMTTSGTVIASIAANRAVDATNLGNLASTSTDNVVVWSQPGETDKPTVTINQSGSQPDPTTAPTIVFDVVFSEPVTGFTPADVILGGTAGATVKQVTGSLANYTVTVSGMTQSGTVTATIPAGAAQDPATNTSFASTSTDNSVQWNLDNVAPTVTVNQAVAQGDPAITSPILFTATFSEAVTGFTTGDVTLGGTAGATTAVVTGGPIIYTITVSGMTGNGTVTASIGGGVATDAALNPNAASTSTDNTVTFDGTKPSVTVNKAAGQADPTSGSTVQFTVVFSESVTGFAAADVTIGGTAAPTTKVVAGGPATYTVTVGGFGGDGTVTATVPAGGATDGAGNTNTASTSTDNSVLVDRTAPSVTVEQAAVQADPSTGASIQFTATFSEAVSGFTAADVTVGGTAGATTAAVSGGPEVFVVTVTGMTTNGTVTAAIPAGAATDAVGNASTASTSVDNVVTHQLSSAPLTTLTPGGPVTVSVPAGSQLLGFTSATPSPPPPFGVTFPYGMWTFSAATTAGGLVTFTFTLPAPVTNYYKLVSTTWQPFTWDGETGAQVAGTTLTVTIRDNGRGDADPTPGIVTDPGAPGLRSTLPATGADGDRMLWPAGMFVAAGVILLLGRRRRPTAVVTGSGGGTGSGLSGA